MERIIVSVRYADRPTAIELDLPADVPAGQLAAQIAKALGLRSDAAYAIEAVSGDRRLRPDESLAAAQIWDGDFVRLVPMVVAPAAALPAPAMGAAATSTPPTTPPLAPVTAAAAPLVPTPPQEGSGTITWRPIDPAPTPAAPARNEDGYVWKPLSDPRS